MTSILVAIVTLLVVAAMVQIVRVSELLAELKGGCKRGYRVG